MDLLSPAASALNVNVRALLYCFCWANFVFSRVGSDDADARAAQLERIENETYSLQAIWWKHSAYNHTPHLYFVCLLYTHKQQVFFLQLCEGKLELLQCVYMNWLLTNYVSWWARRGLWHFVFVCMWRFVLYYHVYLCMCVVPVMHLGIHSFPCNYYLPLLRLGLHFSNIVAWRHLYTCLHVGRLS